MMINNLHNNQMNLNRQQMQRNLLHQLLLEKEKRRQTGGVDISQLPIIIMPC